jgi:hypothetical protein
MDEVEVNVFQLKLQEMRIEAGTKVGNTYLLEAGPAGVVNVQ